jgi:hypothetical protein
MDAESMGYIGGAISTAAALCVGIIAPYRALRGAQGPRERSTVIKLSIALWLFILPLGVAEFLLPDEYGFFAFYPLWLVLPFYARFWSERQQRAEEQDSRDINSNATN